MILLGKDKASKLIEIIISTRDQPGFLAVFIVHCQSLPQAK
jgi:hypothetical protein